MIIQPINSIFKDDFRTYKNTVLHSTLEEYQQSNSGIYVDFENNLVKFKNHDQTKYCWLQIPIVDIHKFDEFYIEYEIRNCKGMPLKLSIENNNIYRYNAYFNESSEWEKHSTKIIVNNNETRIDSSLIAIGNTVGDDFECEIRNIKIKVVSTKEDNYILNKKLEKKVNEMHNNVLSDQMAYIGDYYYIGTTADSNNGWFTFKFFHFSANISNLHSISSYVEQEYIISHLGVVDNKKHFKVFKKRNGEFWEFYLEVKRAVDINDTIVFRFNSYTVVELPLKKIESIPVDAEEMIPIEYAIPRLNKV